MSRLRNLGLMALAIVPMGRRIVQANIDYEKSVISLCTVLSSNPRYARGYSSVDAAVRACGVHPDTLYEIAARGESLPVAFREALYGPGENKLH